MRLEVFATAAILAVCHCAAAQPETPEQRFAYVWQASLQRREMSVEGRHVPIKLVLLTCLATSQQTPADHAGGNCFTAATQADDGLPSRRPLDRANV